MKKSLLWIVVLVLSISMVTAFSLYGCKVAEEEAEEAVAEAETTEVAEETDAPEEVEGVVYKQSPILDEQNLPPVEERLPKEPKVVNEMTESQLDYQIGNYGGTLRTATVNVGWDVNVWAMNKESLLNTPSILGEEITGNVLKGYQMSKDQKEFTFYMREGLKWSDGEPVTSEDIDFTVNDILLNTELTPILPSWLKSGGDVNGTPVDFEVIDEYTFKMTFDEPYGGILIRMAIKEWTGYSDLLTPKHYLKQFHIKYTPLEDMEPVIKENGLQPGDWANLLNLKNIISWSVTQEVAIGFPTLDPWMMTEVNGAITTYKRNPYYFKVDKEGNQLPYIDELRSERVNDMESITLKMISGEVDFDGFQGALMNMSLYQENSDVNGFKIVMTDYHLSPADLYLNLSYDDPTWQEVVGDLRFRRAVSYAINRSEILDAVYYNFGSLTEILDSTFDVEEANKLLDEMGMEEGADGYRLSPNGEKFTIPIEFVERAPDMATVAELLVAMLEEVGIRTTVKSISFSLYEERLRANDLKAAINWTEIIWYNMGRFAMEIVAFDWYTWWNTGGSEGIEPPEEAKNLYRLLDEIAVAEPQDAIMKYEEVKENLGDNIWFVQILGTVDQPIIANAKLGNVEPKDSAWMIGVAFSGETFFFGE